MGWSPEGLDRMRHVMTRYAERGDVSGLVFAMSRAGETVVEAIGKTSFATPVSPAPADVRSNTIFRITSMTKPVTAVAAMILVEDCRLRLDDPVDRWLPELANRRVLTRLDGPLDETVPAARAVTVRDLLTFRMGFGVVFGSPDRYPILKAAQDHQLMIGPPKPRTPHSPDEWLRHLGGLPLMAQPGEQWMYTTSADVLGVLIARASDQPLDLFFRERIFDPLGMTDTGFSVPDVKLDRVATCYQFNSRTQSLDVLDGVHDSQWRHTPVFPAGRDGLVSTADDYLAFGEMMLGNGQRGRTRILSRPSIELMTADHLTPSQKAGAEFFLGANRGWGFGLSVITKRDDLSSTPGRFGWDGGYGTSWYADPREDLTAVLMTQRAVGAHDPGIDRDFWTLVYQSIGD